MVAADGVPERDILDFLAEYALDRDLGRELPLAHYLSRFPGREEAIAREYLQLHADSAAALGDRIGPYQRIAELGRGGQGVVWLARDTRVDRHVALKVLHDGLRAAISPARFRREAELAARIEHPGIDTVYDVGEAEGRLWLATRYVPGESLATLIARAPRDPARGRVPAVRLPGVPADAAQRVDAVLRMIESVAAALHAAHRAGVVHRDVKPGNLLVPEGGQPVLVDFGLARAVDPGSAQRLTVPGELLGTPAYMAPELLASGSGESGPAADLWALAVVLFECLTLEPPFRGATPAALHAAIRERPVPPLPWLGRRSLTRDLDSVLQVALDKDPARRYRDAATFAEDLRRIRLGLTPLARPPGRLHQALRFCGRHPRLVAAVVGLVAVLVLALVYVEGQRRRADLAVARAEARAGDLRRLCRSLVGDLHAAVRELPGSTEVNRELLAAALDYLELLRRETDGAFGTALRDDVVQACLLVGDVLGNPRQANLGDAAGARRHYRQALALLDPVPPDDPEHARLYSAGLLRLGELDEREHAPARALAHWQRALDQLEPVPPTAPVSALQVALHLRRGETLAPAAPRAAIAELRTALGRIARVRGAAPDLVDVDLQEVAARLLLARLLLEAGDAATAAAEHRQAAALLVDQPALHDHVRRAHKLLIAADAIAALLAADGAQAARLMASAAERSAALCAADPRDEDAARLLVLCRCDEALLAMRRGGLALATRRRAAAIAAAEQRSASFGAGWAVDLLVRSDAHLGTTAARRGEPRLAACLLAASLQRQRPRCSDDHLQAAASALRVHLSWALLRLP